MTDILTKLDREGRLLEMTDFVWDQEKALEINFKAGKAEGIAVVE